jgi:hypothetical protein
VQIPLPTQPLQQEVVVEVRIEPLPNLSHPSLGNHETPKPVFMVRLPFLNHPKPFPPLAWKAWAAQASPSAAFWAFPNPFPPHSWEPCNIQYVRFDLS